MTIDHTPDPFGNKACGKNILQCSAGFESLGIALASVMATLVVTVLVDRKGQQEQAPPSSQMIVIPDAGNSKALETK